MSKSIIPVSASTWKALSAYYPYDTNISIKNDYIKWTDGYTAFDHAAFKENIDFSINKDTTFYLPSAKSLFTFIKENGLEDAYQGTYLLIQVDTGQYIAVSGTSLIVNNVSGNNSFFRFKINDDNSFSLLQGAGLYVTVDTTTPFNLTMANELSENESYRQKFYWINDDTNVYFTTKVLNPAATIPTYEERFWSYSKAGLEKGRVRANGFLNFNDYKSNYLNNYLLKVSNFAIFYSPNGLISDHNWVQYYNQFNYSVHNKDTEIFKERSTSGVYISHLFDLPYNTKINVNQNSMAVNLANLKNYMTSEYEYRVKPNPTTITIETSSVSCPAGYSGSGLLYERTITTDLGGTITGSWILVSTNCNPNYTITTQLSTKTCPTPLAGPGATYERSVTAFATTSTFGEWILIDNQCYPITVTQELSTISCSLGYAGTGITYQRDVSSNILGTTYGDWAIIYSECVPQTYMFSISNTYLTAVEENEFIFDASSISLGRNAGNDSDLQFTTNATNVVYLPQLNNSSIIYKYRIKNIAATNTDDAVKLTGKFISTKSGFGEGNPSRSYVDPDRNFGTYVANRSTNEIIYLENIPDGTPGTSDGSSVLTWGTDISHKFTIFLSTTYPYNSASILTNLTMSEYDSLKGSGSSSLGYGIRALTVDSRGDLMASFQTTGRWYRIPKQKITDAINGISAVNFEVETATVDQAYGCVADSNDTIWSVGLGDNAKYVMSLKDRKLILIGPFNTFYGISIHENRYVMYANASQSLERMIIIDSLCPTLTSYMNTLRSTMEPNIESTVDPNTFIQNTSGLINDSGKESFDGLGNTGITYPLANVGTTYAYTPFKVFYHGRTLSPRVYTVYDGIIFFSGGFNGPGKFTSHKFKDNRDSDSIMFSISTANINYSNGDDYTTLINDINTRYKCLTGVFGAPSNYGTLAGVAITKDDNGKTGLIITEQESGKIYASENIDYTENFTTSTYNIAGPIYNYTNFTGYKVGTTYTDTGNLSFILSAVRPDTTITQPVSWTNVMVDVRRDPSSPTSMPASATVTIYYDPGLSLQKTANMASISLSTIEFKELLTNPIISKDIVLNIKLDRKHAQAVNDPPETLYINGISASIIHLQ